MCGFAGVVSSRPLERERLESAARTMTHRGPNSMQIARPLPFSAAFCRLAILDLSSAGNQPMQSEASEVTVVCNGEIYNFAELRKELEIHHEFQSRSDCEVLLHGYEEWGLERLLHRIDGMFALAIWERRRQELWLARDRVGKKPLYYTRTSDGIAFASTLNALLELMPDQPGVDLQALDQYLVYQAVPAPLTIYEGVRMLPPAHYLSWTGADAVRETRYWDLSYREKRRRPERELLDELDGLVRVAVRRRLVADVPLGAFLSGGVDSSLVVGVMSDLGAGPVEAINVGFQDVRFDERPYARAVAKRWAARLHEHVIDDRELQRLPEIVWHYGQPLADVSIIPTYAVARAASQHVTVVMNGDGGDEGFAGYARPLVARAAELYRSRVPSRWRPAAAGLTRLLGRRGRMLARAAAGTGREAFVYERGLGPLRHRLYAPELLDDLSSMDPDEHYRSAWDRADGPSDLDRVLYGELTSYLPDQLLVKMDVSTMAHSVEARSPLLDTAVLEFAATIPGDQLTRGFQTKYLLKRLAERYAPKDVVNRQKRGFVMPVSEWLRGPILNHTRSLLLSPASAARGLFCPAEVNALIDEHASGHRDWGDPIWTLVVLEIWFKLFIDRSLGRSDPLDAVLE